MEYKSHAKINLFLDVISRLENGYHEIKSVFSEIDLHDIIVYNKNDTDKIKVTDDKNILPDENLLTKAAKIFIENIESIPFGMDFHVIKNIPIGGGLGGGSSNAAAVLKILNKEWNINFSNEKLEIIASKIGADVPFFIRGGLQEVSGIGEVLQSINVYNFNLNLLMIIPEKGISTKRAYEMIDLAGLARIDNENTMRYDNLVSGLLKSDTGLVTGNIYNKFEEVVFKEYEELVSIKEIFTESGAIVSFMSGSGSSMFGIYDSVSVMESAILRFSVGEKRYNSMPVNLNYK